MLDPLTERQALKTEVTELHHSIARWEAEFETTPPAAIRHREWLEMQVSYARQRLGVIAGLLAGLDQA